MFRGIGSRVVKRQEELKTTTTNNLNAHSTVMEFLVGIFGSAARKINIEVTMKHDNLFLRTGDKTVANEIIFNSRGLYELLKNKGIKFGKVIVQ